MGSPVAPHFDLIADHERADQVDFARAMPTAFLAVEVSAAIRVRRANKEHLCHSALPLPPWLTTMANDCDLLKKENVRAISVTRSHNLRPSHCPNQKNEQRFEASRKYVSSRIGGVHTPSDTEITYQHKPSTAAPFLTDSLKFAKFQVVKIARR